MNRAKLVASSVGSGPGSVAAVGDETGGCEVDVGGVSDDIVVAEVAVGASFDVAAFFAVFFLLEGAGIIFGADFGLECVVGLENGFDRVKMRRVGQQHVG